MSTKYEGTPEEVAALDLYIKLSRAAESATHHINRHLQAENLTMSQFGALEALYFLGPLRPGQLAHKILKSGGNMTLVINNLVKRGLVTRQRREEDRRCIDIEITPAGQTLIANIFPRHVAGIVDTMSVLSENEQEQLSALCRKLGLAAANNQPPSE